MLNVSYQRNHGDSCKSRCYNIVRGNKSKGIPSQYWFHPYLFLDFALWINPEFKYTVIKFVYDQLIEYRHNAGDMNVHFRSRICRHFKPDADFYMRVNRGLNHIIKKTHYRGVLYHYPI